MRKFLVILLIAAIACVEVSNTKEKVTEDELLKLLNIDSVEMGFIKKVVRKIGNFGKKVWNGVKNGINFLKQKGWWEPIKTILKTAGKAAATAACSAYLSPAVCAPVINILL